MCVYTHHTHVRVVLGAHMCTPAQMCVILSITLYRLSVIFRLPLTRALTCAPGPAEFLTEKLGEEKLAIFKLVPRN